MNRFGRLLFISFIESFATVIIQRGLYFYTSENLGFSDSANLSLALAVGASFMAAALISHPIAKRFGERTTLIAVFLGQLVFVGSLFMWPNPWTMYICASFYNFCCGIKWPIIESYVSAGKTPKQTAKALGWFNVTWASAVPISIMLAGPMIEYWPRDWPPGIFLIGVVISIVSLIMIFSLERHPVHLAIDHPDRLDDQQRNRLRSLMISSRWSTVNSYGLLFLLAPLMPGIFDRMGYSIQIATALAAGIDVLRVVFFALLRRYEGWHGRASYLVLVTFALPIGFSLVLAAEHLPWSTVVLLLGEFIFGAGAGLAYYSSLYYGMITDDASVEAGGVHEAMIGSGLALGPGIGLAALKVGRWVGSATAGTFILIGPSLIFMTVGALWPLRRRNLGPDTCPSCGYDLTGNETGLCPECGAKTQTAADPKVPH